MPYPLKYLLCYLMTMGFVRIGAFEPGNCAVFSIVSKVPTMPRDFSMDRHQFSLTLFALTEVAVPTALSIADMNRVARDIVGPGVLELSILVLGPQLHSFDNGSLF